MDTIARFKRGERIKKSTLDAFYVALEKAGVEFIEAGPYQGDGGPGVRLKPEGQHAE
ncbi:XRE family transcriptional regulator [Azospirillum doebereinerae]|uniref:XRE family transcriptional regulator n=1 Tax=Azospirillum doebereinerae TaxID=92933 RepID=UPI00384DEC55